MAQTTPSTSGSQSQDHGPVDSVAAARLSASRRRDKPQLSCGLCRHRKTRCDRQRPCSNCLSRGYQCVYPDNETHRTIKKHTASNAQSLQDRLVQLEHLVLKFGSSPAHQNTNSTGTTNLQQSANTDTPVDDISETGSMHVSSSEHRYVGSDHWTAILESIADLKDHFDREEQLKLAESPAQTPSSDNVDDGYHNWPLQKRRALLLYGCRPAVSKTEILAALPPKNAVDRYIARYFNRLDLVASSSVHGPTFLDEYEHFWTDPDAVPIMWVGLLYSMICLAVIASDPVNHKSDQEQQQLEIELYREKLVQCLMMGNYTRGGQHSLETFLNYVYVEFRIHDDAEKDVWFLLGLEVNLAKRMGYHRDPKHFHDISPLHGEMRRRVWAAVLLGDILISGQMGMPRMVRDHEFDTAEPQNLNDEDLNGDLAVLPDPRPETEHTTSLGIIARRRILIALGTISDLTASLTPCSYGEIMRIDAILHAANMSVPLPLKMKSMAASITDSPRTIMARLFLGHMFYKGQLMLHRRFLFTTTASPTEDTYSYSRNACLEAALATLDIQKILDDETCPGGQLDMMHWRVGSIMNHHFLTATMVLCSLLYRKQTLGRRDDILSALRVTRSIWIRKGDGSREAKKAAQAVSIVLAHAGGPRFDMSLFFEKKEEVAAVLNNGNNEETFSRGGKADEYFDFDDMEAMIFDDTLDLDLGFEPLLQGLL